MMGYRFPAVCLDRHQTGTDPRDSTVTSNRHVKLMQTIEERVSDQQSFGSCARFRGAE
jgi:hypothetical protein